MTLLDHGQPADTTTKKHRTGLIAVLAVLAVALLAAGAWLIVDRQQQPLSAEEQQHAALIDVVTAHFDAVNARDADALRATLTDDFTWDQDGWIADADTYLAATMGYGTQEPFTGDGAVFSGDLGVTVPSDLVGEGTYLFILREVDGQLKIASVVQQSTQQPPSLPTEEQQAAIMDVITAHRDAVEARDQDAILATLTDDATALYLLSKTDDPMVISRDGYPGFVGWGGDKLTFLADPVFFFDDPPQMAARARVEYPGLMVNDGPAEPRVGTYVFTLREVDGQLKIASIVFTES
jgi:ketosteroid isomerase-like protein